MNPNAKEFKFNPGASSWVPPANFKFPDSAVKQDVLPPKPEEDVVKG
jgi:hypothetical protein